MNTQDAGPWGLCDDWTLPTQQADWRQDYQPAAEISSYEGVGASLDESQGPSVEPMP